MAHTKGPWFYDERTESIGFADGWLGSTKGREGEGLGDQHDDGRAMAAAPRLLKALKAVEWVNGQEPASGMGGMMEQVCPWCDKVGTPDDGWAHNADCVRQAALDKASGTGEG